MNKSEIRKIASRQRAYFQTGATLPIGHRVAALLRLKEAILRHEVDINRAIAEDLGKSAYETYMCETGLVLSEISYIIKHIRSFAAEKTVYTPLAQFASRSYVKPSPHGVVLIMSPWNYPFLLTIEPLVDALAAGNTAIVKPSAYSPATGTVMAALLAECFPEKMVAVVTGGRAENQALLGCEFDYVFFTGSKAVGSEVMKAAAEHLTPVTLELGGKSPCIVDTSADLKLAAKRIIFGKFINCGQTCVAPDYVYCDAAIKDELLIHMILELHRQYGGAPLYNKTYGKIVNEKHFKRLMELIEPAKVVAGGKADSKQLKIEPTIMDEVTFDDAVMQEEIFGPILPILTFDNLHEAVSQVNRMAHPLALYLFSENRSAIKYVTSRCGYGGGCINDTVIHLATSEMGFGGFRESGMGSYHGKAGFDTFSHNKSIVDKKTWIDLPMRYQPYTRLNEWLVHLFLH